MHMGEDSPFLPTGIPKRLPRGPHHLDRDLVLASQRGRLLLAIAELSGAKGYENVTIKDITTAAGTAKSTFYKHFTDKEDCYLQAFDLIASFLITAIADAITTEKLPNERFTVGFRAFIATLREFPGATIAFFIEPGSGGPSLFERRIEVTEAFAEAMVQWRHDERAMFPDLPELSKRHALAAMLAMRELITVAVHHGGVANIAAQEDEILALGIAFIKATHRNVPPTVKV